MSKATRQSITLLSVMGGCLLRINEDKMFSLIHMRELVDKGYVKVVHALRMWPRSGDDTKNVKWVTGIIDKWESHVVGTKDYHRLPVFAKVLERCLADLRDQISNPYKLGLLMDIIEPVSKIHDFVDPNGENFVAYEKCDELMDKLYELIEWG